jgi:hypothetical protein
VEVRWRCHFRSTSLGKRCTSYYAPPTSRKRAAYRWSLRNFLSRSSLFMVGKAQKWHAARFEFNSVFGLGKVDRWNPIRTFPYSPEHVFEKWVERCKKCIAWQGRYFEKETVTAPPLSPTRSSKWVQNFADGARAHTHTHTHTHIYVCMYVCMYVCISRTWTRETRLKCVYPPPPH